MSLVELGTEPTTETTAEPVTETATESTLVDGQSAATEPTTEPVAKTETNPSEGRVVELSRGKRSAERERDHLRTEYDAYKAKYEPLVNLLELAAQNPLEWIGQMAEIAGLTPDRVQEVIATRAAGGEIAETTEERLMRLERQLTEKEANQLKADEAKNDADHATLRTSHISATGTFLKSTKDYPLTAAKGAEAAEAVYEMVEAQWPALKKAGRVPKNQTELQALYKEAAAKVEQVLRADVEALAPHIGYARASNAPAGEPAPKSFLGMSNEHAGTPSLPTDRDTPRTLAEIEEIARQMFGL